MLDENVSIGGRQAPGFSLGQSSGEGVSPVYAAAMTGAAAGLLVLVLKGPLWGAIVAFSSAAMVTKLSIDRA